LSGCWVTWLVMPEPWVLGPQALLVSAWQRRQVSRLVTSTLFSRQWTEATGDSFRVPSLWSLWVLHRALTEFMWNQREVWQRRADGLGQSGLGPAQSMECSGRAFGKPASEN
jgi:hypothetical protein